MYKMSRASTSITVNEVLVLPEKEQELGLELSFSSKILPPCEVYTSKNIHSSHSIYIYNSADALRRHTSAEARHLLHVSKSLCRVFTRNVHLIFTHQLNSVQEHQIAGTCAHACVLVKYSGKYASFGKMFCQTLC